jgi:hypothetical protein
MVSLEDTGGTHGEGSESKCGPTGTPSCDPYHPKNDYDSTAKCYFPTGLQTQGNRCKLYCQSATSLSQYSIRNEGGSHPGDRELGTHEQCKMCAALTQVYAETVPEQSSRAAGWCGSNSRTWRIESDCVYLRLQANLYDSKQLHLFVRSALCN